MRCRWLSDDFSEICVNGECPYCADWCPVTEHPEVCRWAEETGQRREAEGEGRTSSVTASPCHLPHRGKAFGDDDDSG